MNTATDGPARRVRAMPFSMARLKVRPARSHQVSGSSVAGAAGALMALVSRRGGAAR